MVIVRTGYLLGPYGDEIMIDHDRCFDLRTQCMSGVTGDPCSGSVPDPMCSGASTKPPTGPLYIAVRYQDSLAKPVRVQPVGCGCDDGMCEYSRCQDGYEICVLNQCPSSHQNPLGRDTFLQPGVIPVAPPCPTDPWVVLATFTVDANGNDSIHRQLRLPPDCAVSRSILVEVQQPGHLDASSRARSASRANVT